MGKGGGREGWREGHAEAVADEHVPVQPSERGRVSPKVFEFVMRPFLFEEDVDEERSVIEHDPVAGRGTLKRAGMKAMRFLHLPFQGSGQRLELRRGTCGADEKEIGKGAEIAQIENDRRDRFPFQSDVPAKARQGQGVRPHTGIFS